MRLKLLSLLLALAASVSVMAETTPVYFRSFLNLGDALHFSVSTGDGAKTAWVGVGDSFNGYEVIRFEPAEKVLVLRKDEKEIRIGLAAARVAKEKEATSQVEGAKLILAKNFEDMVTNEFESYVTSQKDMMNQMFAQKIAESTNEKEKALYKRIGEGFGDLDLSDIRKSMAQSYEETFTPEELSGLVDFYSKPGGQTEDFLATPAGEAYLNKQTEYYQRLLPRMGLILETRSMEMMGKVLAEFGIPLD